MYMYIYEYVCSICICMCVYIYIERESPGNISENSGKILAVLLGLYETNVGTITLMLFV